MSNSDQQSRDAYYRQYYQFKDYNETLSIKTAVGRPELYAIAQKHLAQVIAHAATTHRLHPYKVESRSQQLAYLRSQYGDAHPEGVGISQGEYASIARADTNATNRFIATDGLIDCHALVLVARDAAGQVTQTLLAHIDAKTSIQKAMPELLATMPPHTKIEATIIGSPNSCNPYLQADLVETLSHVSQVTRIRYNFDAAHTIAVDTTTGHILTATGPAEPLSKVRSITEWPITIAFPPYGNEAGFETSSLTEHFFKLQRQKPAFGLQRSYDAKTGFIIADPLAQFIIDRQHNEGKLDASELREIAAQIGSTLNAHITLDYQVDAQGRANIDILGAKGKKISSFISNKLDEALGTHGTIEPPNTPPAPGRASARDTR